MQRFDTPVSPARPACVRCTNLVQSRRTAWRFTCRARGDTDPIGTTRTLKIVAGGLLTAVTASLALPALAEEAVAAVNASSDNGWLTPIVDSLNYVLGNIESVYKSWGVPYSYGWSIVTLTAFVKVLTLPLTKKQVESAMAVQNLKPRIDNIKERYGENKDKVQKETSRLYEQAGVNPLAGCLPSIASIPIFIGLYRSLSNVATSGALDAEGFLWVPSLAGPLSEAAKSGGGGTSWLFPFIDGAPPIGWPDASAYLVFPVLLVLAQYASTAIISPVDPNDEQPLTQVVLINGLPLLIGWFSLNVPAGLSLYYFSNSIFTSAQQIYFRKLGGVVLDTPDLGPVKKLGMGRRTGELLVTRSATELPELGSDMGALSAEFAGASAPQLSNGNDTNGAMEPTAEEKLARRAKRKKQHLLPHA